jgi:hypothetical protein
MTFKKNGETNFWWFKSYGSACLTGFGAVTMAAGILCVVFGLIGLPHDVEEIFRWLIVPEIQYLEMLMMDNNISPEAINKYCIKNWNIETYTKITGSMASSLIEKFKTLAQQ